MQLSITQFMRDALSGISDSPQGVVDALIIPVSRRTTLGRSRTQINKIFDRAEKALTADDDRRIKTLEKTGRVHIRKAAAYTPANGGSVAAFTANNVSAVGTVLGMALAMGPYIVDQLKGVIKSVVSGVDSYVKGVAGWLNDQMSNLKDATVSAWKWVAKKSSDLWGWVSDKYNSAISSLSDAWDWTKDHLESAAKGVGDWASSTYKSISESVEDAAKSTSEHASSWYDSVVDWAKSVSESPEEITSADSAEVPTAAKIAVSSAVATFWSAAMQSMHKWLWSMFGMVQDEDAQDGKSGGGSGVGPAGPSGGGGGGSGGGGSSGPTSSAPATPTAGPLAGGFDPHAGQGGAYRGFSHDAAPDSSKFGDTPADPGKYAPSKAAAAYSSAHGISQGILDLTSKGEAGGGKFPDGGYNTFNGDRAHQGSGYNLTKMTLDELDKLQTERLSQGKASDSGRWQLTRTTIRDFRNQMGLTGKELFDPDMQQKIITRLLALTHGDPSKLRGRFVSLVQMHTSDEEIRKAWQTGTPIGYDPQAARKDVKTVPSAPANTPGMLSPDAIGADGTPMAKAKTPPQVPLAVQVTNSQPGVMPVRPENVPAQFSPVGDDTVPAAPTKRPAEDEPTSKRDDSDDRKQEAGSSDEEHESMEHKRKRTHAIRVNEAGYVIVDHQSV